MNSKGPMTPRDAYQAYLKGEITPSQAETAVQDWYAASQRGDSKAPKQG
ncbi:MAG: hypothetical protein O2798_04245 [Chloroflexi bacterium]|nr:hypothetical protein [Chloroflexota bacterium]MDA1240035.1 hypothetical protein [Chloroflexota bacterium]